MKLFLDIASRLCSCSVHVRRPQTSHPNPGARSAPGRRRHAPPPRPRPQPRSQADRLRQAARRHGAAARRHPRLRLPRQTVRHRRYRRHPRPHHLWPAPGRDAGSQALQTRRARPGPHGSAHPPARHTRAGRRSGGRAAGRPARRPSQDPRLARLPTEEEIAEEVRRRPVGAVIVDICCDLGIAPGRLDRAFWDEINHALMVYGGSSVRFFNDLEKRLWASLDSADPSDRDPGCAPAPQRLPVPATGPP